MDLKLGCYQSLRLLNVFSVDFCLSCPCWTHGQVVNRFFSPLEFMHFRLFGKTILAYKQFRLFWAIQSRRVAAGGGGVLHYFQIREPHCRNTRQLQLSRSPQGPTMQRATPKNFAGSLQQPRKLAYAAENFSEAERISTQDRSEGTEFLGYIFFGGMLGCASFCILLWQIC